MSTGWTELKWHAKVGAKRPRKRQDGPVGPAAGPPRRQPGTEFNLAKEAAAMMHRTAFDDILEACATTEPRMVAVYAVMQALLGELRRVGRPLFFVTTLPAW